MNMENRKEVLRTIDITRKSVKNSMEVFLDVYTEVISELDTLSRIVLKDKDFN